jgi:hypothetical protein
MAVKFVCNGFKSSVINLIYSSQLQMVIHTQKVVLKVVYFSNYTYVTC